MSVAAEVCPFAQVRFAKNYGASVAQLLNNHGIRRHAAAKQRKRSRGRLHTIVSRDVVLHQNGNAVKRATDVSSAALTIEMLRDGDGIWDWFR